MDIVSGPGDRTIRVRELISIHIVSTHLSTSYHLMYANLREVLCGKQLRRKGVCAELMVPHSLIVQWLSVYALGR